MRKSRGDVYDPYIPRLLAVTVLIFVGMALIRPGAFLTLTNIRSMSFQFPEFALLALAVMLTMLTGGIDLSIVSTALLSAILGVLALNLFLSEGAGRVVPVPLIVGLAVLVALCSGLACGLLNGWLIAKVRISPILATLGTMQLLAGLAVVLTGGSTIYDFPPQFVFIGNGSVVGIPLPLLIFALSSLTAVILLNRTRLGLKIYLLGNNVTAALFSGIDSHRVIFKTYAFSGLLSAMAGLIMVARTNSANAEYGSSYLLLAILVAVLGGVNPSGGFGKISGLVLAVLSLQFLSSGMNMLRVSSFTKEILWGGLLLMVMGLSQLGGLRKRGEG